MTALAESVLERWIGDWSLAAEECFPGFVPDRWQSLGLRAIGSRKPLARVAFKACAGPGKSAVMAIASMLAMLLQSRKDAYHVSYVLSITKDNLTANLWREITIWYGRSPVMQAVFELTASELRSREHPGEWWMRTRSFAKDAIPEAQGESLSGLHGPYVTVWLDETGSMHPIMLKRAEQAMVGVRWGRIVQSGNPTDMTGALYRAVADDAASWEVIEITGDPDNPDAWVHGARAMAHHVEGDDCACPMCWARAEIRKHGRDNPWVQAYILGRFPPGGFNTLLSPDEVRDAMKRNPQKHEYEWAQKRLGIDVARMGGDRSVIFPRQGLMAHQPVVMRKQDTNAIGARVLVAIHRWGSEAEFIDDTGHWGHGVVDNLIASGRPAQPVIFSDPAQEPQYFNRRAEMWFRMAEWVKRGGCLPNLPELIPELTVPTYGYKQGKILMQDKEQIKKVLQSSPDLADALALTFAIPDQPGLGGLSPELAELVHQGIGTGHIVRDYDPFDEARAQR